MVRFTNILTTSIVMKLVRPHILNITAILVVAAYVILQSIADQLMLGEFDDHHYSPQAVIYKARDLMNDGTLIPKSVVTLYQWINEGVLRTSNLDIFEKPKRKHHRTH